MKFNGAAVLHGQATRTEKTNKKMAKVTGPLFSFAASGSIANLLTMEQRAHGTTARRKPISTGNPTAPQVAERTRCKDAAAAWKITTAPIKQEWRTLAQTRQKPVFAVYLQEWNAQHIAALGAPQIPFI